MEFEISLAVPSLPAAHAWLAAQAHTTFTRQTKLLNIYLDTPQLDLKNTKAALRLRFDTEQQTWLQTLKTAGQIIDGVHARGEWECVVPTQQINLSLFATDAQAFLAPYIDAIVPIFRTDFTRHIYDYRLADAHFEWALDDGEVRFMDKHAVIRELELEHKSGDLNAMRELANIAQTALDAAPQLLSKAARGYGLL